MRMSKLHSVMVCCVEYVGCVHVVFVICTTDNGTADPEPVMKTNYVACTDDELGQV